MVRRMVVFLHDNTPGPELTEVPADNEAQLQDLIKENPNLLPIDEFGMTGPLLVIGRETSLPSGGVDLVALARSGEILVVEFKTGPQNTDFRHVLAQLLDYGSHLWGLNYDDFESTVPARYFASGYCRDLRVRGKSSLADAARALWTDLSDEEAVRLRDQVVAQLTTGGFHYVVVAQRFTPSVERTVGYLNAAMASARFYAVELVKFSGEGVSAFESRTVLRPERRIVIDGRTGYIDESRFLQALEDETYRDTLREILEACRGQDLRFEWGAAGTSIRLPTVDRAEPLTIGWLFPGGGRGYFGMSDLNLGFDTSSASKVPSVQSALEAYLADVANIEDAEAVTVRSLRVYHFAPSTVVEQQQRITEALASLVRRASGEN